MAVASGAAAGTTAPWIATRIRAAGKITRTVVPLPAAFYLQLTAMHRNELAADRKTQPCPAVFPADRGIRLGEWLAERGQHCRIDADTGIRHHQHDVTVRRAAAMDRDGATVRGELHRIGQQVQDDLPHRAAIRAQHDFALRDAAFHMHTCFASACSRTIARHARIALPRSTRSCAST